MINLKIFGTNNSISFAKWHLSWMQKILNLSKKIIIFMSIYTGVKMF